MKIKLNTTSVKLLILAIRTAPQHRLRIAYADMSRLLFISQRSAQRLVKRLEQAGLLQVERSQERYVPNTYTIDEEYFNQKETPNE